MVWTETLAEIMRELEKSPSWSAVAGPAKNDIPVIAADWAIRKIAQAISEAEGCDQRARAAAPDLLAAAKMALRQIEQLIDHQDDEDEYDDVTSGDIEARDRLRAAIAKAEGRE